MVYQKTALHNYFILRHRKYMALQDQYVEQWEEWECVERWDGYATAFLHFDWLYFR